MPAPLLQGFGGEAMITCGIDWADAKHRVCILDGSGEKLTSFDVAHTPEGLEKLDERLLKCAGGPGEVRIALETKDSLLVDFLSERGYTLYFLNPKQTDRFRDRHRMSSAKDDDFDAYVLADAVRTDAHLLEEVSPLDERTVLLRVLTRTRVAIVERKVACQNELTAALKRYFPAALRLFDDLTHPAGLDFLLRYPTHGQASQAPLAAVVGLLKEHGFLEHQAQRRAAHILAVLQEPQLKPAASAAAAYPGAVSSLLRELRSAMEEITALDRQIEKAFAEHPDKAIFESLPGFAQVLAPVLAAEVGGDVSRFSSVRELKALGGSSPVTKRSGKYCTIQMRYACNENLRRALHLGSQAAVQQCGWARDLYDGLRARNCKYGRALRAVAGQLLEMLYVMLKRKACYDEGYHLRMKETHGKPSLA